MYTEKKNVSGNVVSSRFPLILWARDGPRYWLNRFCRFFLGKYNQKVSKPFLIKKKRIRHEKNFKYWKLYQIEFCPHLKSGTLLSPGRADDT